ncbi:MAG: hypothetical protein QXZ17_15525 [Nitrososphaerota archaeon]
MLKISINDNIELINKLKDKITKYSDEFSRNEALVRYALIDPFLRSLGWDTEDPSVVKPEYPTEAGRPDYALFVKGDTKPVAFVGAKKLGKDEDLKQHISYCVSEGVRYFIATDGLKWELYDTVKMNRLPEKKISSWDILNDDPAQIATESLIIANLGSIESFGKQVSGPIIQNREISQEEAIQNKAPNQDEHGIDNMNIHTKRAPLKPISLTINGEIFSVNKSNEILIRTAEWLISKGKLTKSSAPIESGKDRWLVNSEPFHKNGKKFFNSFKLSNGLFLEMNYGSVRIEQLARSMMKHYGYPENSISIEWRK